MVHYIVALVQEFHHFSAQKWQHQTEETKKYIIHLMSKHADPQTALVSLSLGYSSPARYIHLHVHILCLTTYGHVIERIKNSTWNYLKWNNILEILQTSGISREKTLIFFFFVLWVICSQKKFIKIAVMELPSWRSGNKSD